jgi:hypothetical protein
MLEARGGMYLPSGASIARSLPERDNKAPQLGPFSSLSTLQIVNEACPELAPDLLQCGESLAFS